MKTVDGFKDSNIHFKWDPNLSPIEYVDSGSDLVIQIPDSSTKQIKETFQTSDLAGIDNQLFDGAVGPIFVEGAEPGDALKITINKIETGNWAWTAALHDFGLLSNEFQDELVIWKIKDGLAVSKRKGFFDGMTFKTNPFLGIIGTAPASGTFTMIPPQRFGGNMDNRLNRESSVLYLPVNVKGALVSFADPHALQGDGEVCGTAMETSCNCHVKIEVIKGMKINYPRVNATDNTSGNFVNTMGIGPDILEAAKDAVREMIGILSDQGYKRVEAYMLCSIMGNLRISEIVDIPNYVVTMSMPIMTRPKIS
ncbi:acetamidase/formamidase family protein [Thermoplasmatales archaeon AK]|nr:acetamidase/formamidase family protein [Thermoplasmatales archaeon AK]